MAGARFDLGLAHVHLHTVIGLFADLRVDTQLKKRSGTRSKVEYDFIKRGVLLDGKSDQIKREIKRGARYSSAAHIKQQQFIN